MRPVVSQVDGDLAALGGRFLASASQYLTFELQHLRLIHLEDDRAVGPCQPVGAGIQARSRDDDLADTCVGGGIEVGVEELRARSLVIHEMVPELGCQLVVGCFSVEHVRPLAADRPAEDLRVWVDDQRMRLVGLQSP
jgi:hypothetical protein